MLHAAAIQQKETVAIQPLALHYEELTRKVLHTAEVYAMYVWLYVA